MALQDVCGFQETSLWPRWNFSISSHDATLSPNLADIKKTFSPLHLLLPPPQRTGGGIRSLRPTRPFPLTHGTTTLGFVFQGGAIAAADTRASAGALIACPAAQKVMPIHSHLVTTTSGSGADCMLWERILIREIRLYQLRHRRKLSVGGAAKLLSFMLHPFKGTDVCVALTLCGWDGEETVLDRTRRKDVGLVSHDPLPSDESGHSGDFSTSISGALVPSVPDGIWKDVGVNLTQNKCEENISRAQGVGPRVCYVCSDGLLLKGKLISVGSGSPYAYSVLDDGWRWTMTVDEAVALAREAVYRATHRDAYSGNNVDLFHITAHGWTRRDRENLRDEYYRERKKREREREKERERERD